MAIGRFSVVAQGSTFAYDSINAQGRLNLPFLINIVPSLTQTPFTFGLR